MTIERKNNLGTIKLDDYIFAQIIQTSLSKSGGKAFHASEKGKLLGSQGVKSSIGEISSNIRDSRRSGQVCNRVLCDYFVRCQHTRDHQ